MFSEQIIIIDTLYSSPPTVKIMLYKVLGIVVWTLTLDIMFVVLNETEVGILMTAILEQSFNTFISQLLKHQVWYEILFQEIYSYKINQNGKLYN